MFLNNQSEIHLFKKLFQIVIHLKRNSNRVPRRLLKFGSV